jgi:AraC-like DNA-binding protein
MDQYLTIISIIAHIESHVDDVIDYKALAQSVGFSLAHLRDMFARTTGVPLARYILTRRIANAALALLHDGDRVAGVAAAYGFASHDAFTRAFRRVTGMTPECFRRERPAVQRVKLCAGIYGVGIPERQLQEDNSMNEMVRDLRTSEGSTVLYGVPRVGYGTYQGCTPYPICLKACANYLGDDLTYDEIMVASAAAFRLTWDVTCWNMGNVDISFAFDDYVSSYTTGLRALGRAYKMIMRGPETTKEQFVSFIKEQLNAGYPVIALGIIGPPEACIVTGYRDDGNTLLGWNFFQDNPEFRGSAAIDASGYFVTGAWWENRATLALFAIGEPAFEKPTLAQIAKDAVTVLAGRMHGDYAKGILAYDYWKKAVGNDADFPPGAVMSLLAERIMVHGDATDCLSDGRANAWSYFDRLAKMGDEHSETLKALAEDFHRNAACIGSIFELLGGWQRGEEQMRKLADPAIRRQICALIDEAKAADERALKRLEELANA